MYLLAWYPVQFVIFFSIPPLIAGLLFNINTREDQDKLEQTMKGIGIGLLIDLPFLCFILAAFSMQ